MQATSWSRAQRRAEEQLHEVGLAAVQVASHEIGVAPLQVGRTRFQPRIDLYNALNSATVLTENTTYGAQFRLPTNVLPARLVKFGLQVDF